MPEGAGKYLAMYNFGLHVAAYESHEVEGFRLREAANFEAAARAHGFIGRSGYGGEPDAPRWGEQVFPRFIEGSGFCDRAVVAIALGRYRIADGIQL